MKTQEHYPSIAEIAQKPHTPHCSANLYPDWITVQLLGIDLGKRIQNSIGHRVHKPQQGYTECEAVVNGFCSSAWSIDRKTIGTIRWSVYISGNINSIGAAVSVDRISVVHNVGALMLSMALYYVNPLLPENIFMLCVGIFLIGIGVFVGGLDTLTAESAGRERLWKTVGIVCLAVGIAYVAKFTLDDQVSFHQVSSPKAGITWLKHETSALAQARQEKKPVMMDFYADWCAACKKLERETFANSAVADKAKHLVWSRSTAQTRQTR